ncbi:RNA polymerase sigma factor [Flavobacterium sp. SM2513]|uniref:RNA polymerase sigma factor n=1 Tax=Flavobacterium sp. SM2513 TaxID=3424766 RepID=UPI003D7F5B8B
MHHFNWNEIYTNTSPKLLGICRRYIKDIATAEDIIQDSFIVAIQKEDTLKDKKALNGWLSRIVINMALHHLKDVKKINFSTDQAYEIVDSTTVMNTLELDNRSILLSSDLERSDILEAIDQLPEHHKSVFNMYVIDQFSHNEISQALQISVGTSKSHLSRARKALQVFLLEKIKGKPVDENKKRSIAFLLFLGFGNQLFAHFCRNQFIGFEIQPQRELAFASKYDKVPPTFVGLSNVAVTSKVAALGLPLLIVAGSLFYVYFYNSTPPHVTKEATVIKEVNEVQSNQEVVIGTDDSVKKEKNGVEFNQKEIIPELSNGVVSPAKNRQRKVKTVSKTVADTLKTEPKKVIVIKKQIIKKDTVYVTK